MSAPVPPPAPPAEDDCDARIEYLRARGVEVELPEERAAAAAARAAPPLAPTGPAFRFVRIPAEPTDAVAEEVGHAPADGSYRDTLKDALTPRFGTDASMDEATVARETASRLQNMVIGGGDENGMTLKAPSVLELQKQAVGGVCEAWPLAQPTEANGWNAVRLYIDEVGALRSRPRNARAEALAHAAGLSGVAIHGDAYVGRAERMESGERSIDFTLPELAHDSAWVLAARREHEKAASQAGHSIEELYVGGADTSGLYTWSQGEEDVEVRVTKGIPDGGKAAKKRIQVSYGKGDSLHGNPLIAPDCS